MASTNRLGQSVGGMVLTVGLALAVVVVIAIFTFRPSDQHITVVDFQPVAASARQSGAFDVALPTNIPSDWKATSVRYRPNPTDPKVATWHLGFYVPEDGYVGIEQTNGTDPGFLTEATARGTEQGEQEINGVTWKKYYSDDSRHYSLAVKQDGVTTVVTGTLSYQELAPIAAGLTTR